MKTLSIAAVSVLCFWACLSLAESGAGMGPASLTVSDLLEQHTDGAAVAAEVATEAANAEVVYEMEAETAVMAEVDADTDVADAEEADEDEAAPFDGPAVTTLAEVDAEAGMIAGDGSASYRFPGHRYGRRDDVSGGAGARKFIAPKGKGCYIELNNCPRYPSVPSGKPFADGWFHKVATGSGWGWFGGKSVQKRCLRRARDFHEYCHGTAATTVTATWRPTGATRSAPHAGCWISQFSCAKHPEYRGKFFDRFDGARSSVNKARCFQRAREYHKWCENPKSITTTAEYRPTGQTQDFPADRGCFIHLSSCPNHPSGTAPPAQSTVGSFRDHWGELNAKTAIDEAACFARAQQYHSWCGLHLDERVTAEFRPSGRTKSYPRDLMAPIDFTDVNTHGRVACKVHTASTLIVATKGGEGACEVPFSALKVPAKRSLAGKIISFDVKFLRKPTDSVGRHGGIYFGTKAEGRSGNHVYDWIDRTTDRGYRVYGHAKNDKTSQLTPANQQPHQHWTIIIREDGTTTFRAGDVTWESVVSAHELDHIKLGFWAWPGNKMKITNFNIRPYSKHYKFHNLIAEGAKKKGNVEFSAITNGVEIRSLGHEGAVSLPMTALGLPHHHSLANKRIAFDIEFTRGHGGAGKHGGIFFGASPKGRAGNAVVDWIETGAKTGYRMYWQMDNEKWDYWSPKTKHPDRHWEIAIDSNFRVQFTAGDTQWMSRLKSSVNDGHIGFWVYHGVTMRITNVFITDLAHDVCSSSPCHNGGNCKADGNDFTCKCAPGFSGADCSKALNRCTPEAIASCNGGKCVSHPKKYKCDCAGTGKHGKRCDGHKLGGWFRADNSAQVFIDDKELIAHSSRGAEVVEINSAANAGSTVTVKALNTNGKGMMIAWLKFRGDSLVTNGNWECSDDVGATWHKATVLGAQGEGAFGSTSNMPAEAKYIWSKNANSRNAWCRTVLPAQAFKAGDRVALPVKTKLSVFCAKSHPGSTTTYYGTVCSNGGVKWTHYYTTFEEVRHELKGQMENCAKARAAADSAENSKFFGDCENAPTLLSEHGFVKTAVAAQIKGLQRELNPCADKPCGRHSKCEWNKDGPFPFKCTCAAGYAGTGQPWRPCRSVDVCATSAPCDHNARCHKTGPGKHECVCKKGFSGSGHKCHAVDACASNPSPCSPNAKCKSMGPGKYSCACHDGFKGNGKTCTEVDPCAKSPCKGAGAKCSKTGAGKFVCSCAAGAVLEDDTCHAADVCHPKPCAKHAKCTVGAGNKAVCECKPNYKGDGKMCSAVNPCNEAGGKDLCGANSICSSHAAGQHKCTCAKGFKSAADGKSCTAVDACDANPCAANAVCKATGPGAYSCTCKSGYIGNGRQCKVADACDAKPCSPYARCATTGPNKHTCTCKDGYSGDGTKCEAVDACKQSPCHAQATCRMTGPGTHVCACNPGFTGSGANCEEIDACKSNPCKNAACAKTGPGKYKCSCNDGFTTKGSTNPDACVEKNNCNADKSPCADNQVCRVTGPAQHKCECKFGFKDVNGKCEEIDRCVDGRPCSPNASCAKTGPGTFLCTCAKGYEGDGITCKPKNNCKKTPSPCHAKARCTSTGPEQHKCECLPGYDGDGVTACLPHDNCLVNPCPANSLCTVSGPGQHRCEARPGFAFTADKKATVEIDNCKNAKAPCSAFAVCAKTGPGTHSCTCKTGYAGDGVTCAPVDICKTGPCDKAAVCKSTGPGTFACKCKDGHFGDGTKGKCEEINLCTSKNPCDPHAECTKTGPAKAECTCLPGYAGDGKKCAEVDPCKATPFPCSANAVCTKTGPALHKCECKPGYKGDGLSCRFDTTELDTHDGKMRTVMDGIDKLIPAANRVAFDGHDAAQNSAIGTMHESLDRVSKHVDKIAATAERTTSSLTDIAKAMKAVHDNTIEKHVIHDGPAPLPTPLVDDTTALPKIGNIADKRQPVPRDAGVSRIAAAH